MVSAQAWLIAPDADMKGMRARVGIVGIVPCRSTWSGGVGVKPPWGTVAGGGSGSERGRGAGEGGEGGVRG